MECWLIFIAENFRICRPNIFQKFNTAFLSHTHTTPNLALLFESFSFFRLKVDIIVNCEIKNWKRKEVYFCLSALMRKWKSRSVFEFKRNEINNATPSSSAHHSMINTEHLLFISIFIKFAEGEWEQSDFRHHRRYPKKQENGKEKKNRIPFDLVCFNKYEFIRP